MLTIEQHIFSWFKTSQSYTIPRVLNAYVDLVGAYQYWDFFAPEAPIVHRYLRVCSEIIVAPGDDQIGCVNPAYKSYDGILLEAMRSFNGARSRSFRFTENLIRLQREDLYELFTRYWWNKGAKNKGGSSQVFLVLTEYPLYLQKSLPHPEYGRKDTVVWISR